MHVSSTPNSDHVLHNQQAPAVPVKPSSKGGERLIRMPELLAVIGISRATAYRYLASGKLPAPVRLSARCIAWKASTISEWLAGLQTT